MIKVFYHQNCVDGNACIWTVLKFFSEKDIRYYGIAFGSDYESIIFNNVEEKDDVFFLDFAPTEKVIITLLDMVSRIYIIDHHNPLYNISNDKISSYIDETHCASYSAFKYFFPQKEVPNILKYIDITDMINTEAKNYYEIAAFVRSMNEEDLEESFKFYEKYKDAKEEFVIKQGREIFKLDYIRMEENLGKIHYREVEMNKKEKKLLPMIEANIYGMGAEIDYKLKQLQEDPNPDGEIPYVAMAYCYEADFVRINIRTNPMYYDASEIATHLGEKYGLTAGGGHRNTAVARFDFKKFRDTFLIKSYYEA